MSHSKEVLAHPRLLELYNITKSCDKNFRDYLSNLMWVRKIRQSIEMSENLYDVINVTNTA